MNGRANGVDQTAASGLAAQVWGEGVPAVMVHGAVSTGEETWEGQRPLADQGFRLAVPDRRGYGKSAGDRGEDFLRDAEDVAELLGDGAHLVGHSYGAIAALLAAAKRPEAVLSLTAVEPPAFTLAADDPHVTKMVDALEELSAQDDLDDRAFTEAFLGLVGTPVAEMPEEMLEHLTSQIGPARDGRPSTEAEIPVQALRAARFPKLVVSGAHHPAFDAVCDRLTLGLGAERAVITGAGHEVQMVAEPFNRTLMRFWRRASGRPNPEPS